MRGIKRKLIPFVVKRDAETVKEEATIVLKMTPEGIIEKRNPQPRLGVIAIIGPGQAFNQHFDETVLCEIGLGRSRPYHEAQKPYRLRIEGESFNIPLRRKWFTLPPDQYETVASTIFNCLQRITEDKVSCWKCGLDNPFLIPTPRNYWSRRRKKLISVSGFKSRPRGVRFSVSLKDEFLVRDILWLELNLNEDLKRHLKGFANFIDLRLACYKKGRESRRRSNFLKLKGVQEIQEILFSRLLSKYCLSKHLLAEMISRYLPGQDSNPLYYDLLELIGWDGTPTEEKKLIESVLLKPEVRLPNINLRVITGLNNGKDHIVFEIFPKRGTKEE